MQYKDLQLLPYSVNTSCGLRPPKAGVGGEVSYLPESYEL